MRTYKCASCGNKCCADAFNVALSTYRQYQSIVPSESTGAICHSIVRHVALQFVFIPAVDLPLRFATEQHSVVVYCTPSRHLDSRWKKGAAIPRSDRSFEAFSLSMSWKHT